MNGIDDVMIESRDGLNNIIMYKLIYGSTLIVHVVPVLCVISFKRKIEQNTLCRRFFAEAKAMTKSPEVLTYPRGS